MVLIKKKPHEVATGLKKPLDGFKYINTAYPVEIYNKIKKQAQEEDIQISLIVRLIVLNYYEKLLD
jgi:hypothetical protein